MTSASFRHLGDEPVHRWGVLSLVRAQFEGPGGETFERTVVRSPGAVAVVPVLDTSSGPEVVLVRQYRPSLGIEFWEVPAGMRDVAGEPPERTAARELEEEAGYRAGRVIGLGHMYPSVGLTDSTQHLFVALDLEPVPSRHQSIEEQHLVVATFPLETALTMVRRGELTDAKTIVGLQWAAEWLQEQR